MIQLAHLPLWKSIKIPDLEKLNYSHKNIEIPNGKKQLIDRVRNCF